MDAMKDREVWQLNLELLPRNPTEKQATKKEEEVKRLCSFAESIRCKAVCAVVKPSLLSRLPSATSVCRKKVAEWVKVSDRKIWVQPAPWSRCCVLQLDALR